MTATNITGRWQDENHVSTVRGMLIEQIRAIRQATTPEALKMETERTKAVSMLAGAVTDIARVEVDYAQAVGGKSKVGFLDSGEPQARVTTPALGRMMHHLIG